MIRPSCSKSPKKPGKAKAGAEDDAVADFLLDLDLDEDD